MGKVLKSSRHEKKGHKTTAMQSGTDLFELKHHDIACYTP